MFPVPRTLAHLATVAASLLLVIGLGSPAHAAKKAFADPAGDAHDRADIRKLTVKNTATKVTIIVKFEKLTRNAKGGTMGTAYVALAKKKKKAVHDRGPISVTFDGRMVWADIMTAKGFREVKKKCLVSKVQPAKKRYVVTLKKERGCFKTGAATKFAYAKVTSAYRVGGSSWYGPYDAVTPEVKPANWVKVG